MPLSDFFPIAAIAASPSAQLTLLRLCADAAIPLWLPQHHPSHPDAPADAPWIQRYADPLSVVVAELWNTQRSLVFGLASGAVVRLIAPLLQDKATDPAVVVVDPAGQFVISLCGGHAGGADQLARLIALQLGATPILTGAAQALDLPAIDQIGEPFGWRKGLGDWTGVSAALARQAPIEVLQEVGSTLWQTHLPESHPFLGPERSEHPSPAARIWISAIQRQFAPDSSLPKVQWHPRVLWLGIGCERGTDARLIIEAITSACRTQHFSLLAIAGVGTISLKADEVGLRQVCQTQDWPLVCFTAEQLQAIPVPHPSPVVAAEVGTPSVAEAAAILAAQSQAESPDLVTLAVSKQIFRNPDYAGAVTVAIATCDREYLGRTGRLWLVGQGPGALSQITPAAQTAITQADVVIGYGLYVDLVRPLLRPGQIVEAFPITQERQRASRAIELAQWGLTVAVISSGDCGIYGMAGLVLEQLQAQGWDGQVPEVEVFPGISAIQSAAARVGAPLMHDFCAISLSDLLTPWPVIERRLHAAAEADFVTAFYNPRSQQRIQQLAIAQMIFLQYRHPQTPVALVRSAYRPDETMTLTTLAEFLEFPIDMLTTVLIGNQATRFHANWMITPRGYLKGA